VDASGKVLDLALLVKKFAKAHGVSDAKDGYLSSYSWVSLVLHFLLRHEYLPPFFGKTAPPPPPPSTSSSSSQALSPDTTPSPFCEGFNVAYSVPDAGQLPPFYVARLASVSLAEVAWLFCDYLTSRVCVERDCLTLRGRGEVVGKGCWDAHLRLDIAKPKKGNNGRGHGRGGNHPKDWPAGRLRCPHLVLSPSQTCQICAH